MDGVFRVRSRVVGGHGFDGRPQVQRIPSRPPILTESGLSLEFSYQKINNTEMRGQLRTWDPERRAERPRIVCFGGKLVCWVEQESDCFLNVELVLGL